MWVKGAAADADADGRRSLLQAQPWLDRTKDFDTRTQLLLRRLTTAEKGE